MFDVGFWELSLIGVLALVILGPERLPVVARTLGRWVRRGRRLVSNFGEELTGDSSIADLREEVRQMRNEIEGHTRDTLNDVDGTSNDDKNTDASEQDSDAPRSLYDFSPDDVDNAPGADEEHDNDEAGADESVEADDIAEDLQEPSLSAPESSVDESTKVDESVVPADALSDDEDEEALYARARRRYAGTDKTKDIEHDTKDHNVTSGRSQKSGSE